MKSAKEMRDELRALRKETLKPVSKMRKGDISAEIEKLKVGREETPASAAVPSAPLKKSMSAVESIKEAKKMEFPQKPSAGGKKSSMAAGKSSVKEESKSAGGDKKKSSKLDRLMKMMEEMSSDEE